MSDKAIEIMNEVRDKCLKPLSPSGTYFDIKKAADIIRPYIAKCAEFDEVLEQDAKRCKTHGQLSEDYGKLIQLATQMSIELDVLAPSGRSELSKKLDKLID